MLPVGFIYAMIGLSIVGIFIARILKRKRRFSRKQIQEFRDWRKGRSEGIVEAKIDRLQNKLEFMKKKRKAEEQAAAREAARQRADELRDARGRDIYGDEWDNVKDLFALTDAEVDYLRREAKAIVEGVPEEKHGSKVAPFPVPDDAHRRRPSPRVFPAPPEDMIV